MEDIDIEDIDRKTGKMGQWHWPIFPVFLSYAYINFTRLLGNLFTCLIRLTHLPILSVHLPIRSIYPCNSLYLFYLSTCFTQLPIIPYYLFYPSNRLTRQPVLPIYRVYLSSCFTCLPALPIYLFFPTIGLTSFTRLQHTLSSRIHFKVQHKLIISSDKWHVTRPDVWRMTHDTWQVTFLSKFQLPSFYNLGVKVFWRYFHKEWLFVLMNEWINEWQRCL